MDRLCHSVECVGNRILVDIYASEVLGYFVYTLARVPVLFQPGGVINTPVFCYWCYNPSTHYLPSNNIILDLHRMFSDFCKDHMYYKKSFDIKFDITIIRG